MCVCSQNLEFTTEVVQLKGFFVVRFDEGPPFELFIRAKDSDEPLWSTTIRDGNQWTQSVEFGGLHLKTLMILYMENSRRLERQEETKSMEENYTFFSFVCGKDC